MSSGYDEAIAQVGDLISELEHTLANMEDGHSLDSVLDELSCQTGTVQSIHDMLGVSDE